MVGPSDGEVAELLSALDAPIAAAFAKGLAAYPHFSVSRQLYSRSIISRLWRRAKKRPGARTEADVLAPMIGAVAAEDLFLVIACNDAERQAAKVFVVDRYTSDLAPIFTPNHRPDDESRALARAFLTGALFLSPETGTTQLAAYAGQSSLRTYLRLLAQYSLRRERRLPSADLPRDDFLEHDGSCPPAMQDSAVPADKSPAPEVGASMRALAPRFLEALRAARLSDVQVAVLYHHVVRGAAQVDVARTLRVNPSAVSRALERGETRIEEAVHGLLTPAELDVVVSVLAGDEGSVLSVLDEVVIMFLEDEFKRRRRPSGHHQEGAANG